MKKLFFLIFLNFIFISLSAYAVEKVNYDKIYSNLAVLDFSYDHDEDPDEISDYEKYTGSPYPLIRISVKLKCKDISLNPGYYLMTPKNRNDTDFVMFKQNGKIIALIPVYEKQRIDPETIYPKPQKPNSLFKRTTGKIKSIIGAPFKSQKRPQPAPRYAINGTMVDAGRYFELWLYQEEYLYKMLFKAEK